MVFDQSLMGTDAHFVSIFDTILVNKPLNKWKQFYPRLAESRLKYFSTDSRFFHNVNGYYIQLLIAVSMFFSSRFELFTKNVYRELINLEESEKKVVK